MDYRKELKDADNEINKVLEELIFSKYTPIFNKVFMQVTEAMKTTGINEIRLNGFHNLTLNARGEILIDFQSPKSPNYPFFTENFSTDVPRLAEYFYKNQYMVNSDKNRPSFYQRILGQFLDDLVISVSNNILDITNINTKK